MGSRSSADDHEAFLIKQRDQPQITRSHSKPQGTKHNNEDLRTKLNTKLVMLPEKENRVTTDPLFTQEITRGVMTPGGNHNLVFTFKHPAPQITYK